MVDGSIPYRLMVAFVCIARVNIHRIRLDTKIESVNISPRLKRAL